MTSSKLHRLIWFLMAITMARVDLQPAFVLHTRPFRDTSLLIDFFTRNYGCIRAVARGVRSSKSKNRGLLLPFVPLLVSWSGKTDLMTLGKIEPIGGLYKLTGNKILLGIYANELLTKLLHAHDPHPMVYEAYQDLLQNLQTKDNPEIKLRLFEKTLLTEIGYGLQLNKDSSGEPIQPDIEYSYQLESGFIKSQSSQPNLPKFLGNSLLNLAENNLQDDATLKVSKRLMRLVFGHLLAGNPLKSRELFL